MEVEVREKRGRINDVQMFDVDKSVRVDDDHPCREQWNS